MMHCTHVNRAVFHVYTIFVRAKHGTYAMFFPWFYQSFRQIFVQNSTHAPLKRRSQKLCKRDLQEEGSFGGRTSQSWQKNEINLDPTVDIVFGPANLVKVNQFRTFVLQY